MADYATREDVELLWGSPLADADEEKVDALIRYASLYLDKATPGVDLDVESEMAQYIVIQMVMRVLRNPTGVKQSTTGPFSATYDLVQAIGRIVVLPEELAILGVDTGPKIPHAGIGTFRVQDGWP